MEWVELLNTCHWAGCAAPLLHCSLFWVTVTFTSWCSKHRRTDYPQVKRIIPTNANNNTTVWGNYWTFIHILNYLLWCLPIGLHCQKEQMAKSQNGTDWKKKLESGTVGGCQQWDGGINTSHKHKSCEKRKPGRDSFGAGGAASLLVGSDYCWLGSTQPAASKTLSMAQ